MNIKYAGAVKELIHEGNVRHFSMSEAGVRSGVITR
jgi:hypothetical protein